MLIGRLGLTALVLLAAVLGLAVAPAFAVAAPEAPLSEAASAVTATSATLHGEPTPFAQATVGYDFTLNTNGTCEPGLQTPPVAEAVLAAGVKEAERVGGLEPNREYVFCLNATSPEGSTPGNLVSFRTLGLAPAIDSETAAAVGSTAATLEAQVNPENESTSFVFEYSTEATGETLEGTITKVPGAEPLAAEFGDRLASVPRVEGLAPGTTYFYRVLAENATGSSAGAVQSFTTPPAPVTDAVESVTASSATLNGHFTLTEAAPTQYFFDYRRGEECAGEFTTPFEEAGTGTGEAKETASISGLQPFSKYTACFDTANAFGTQQGNEVSFETPALPPAIDAESSAAVKDTSATLESQINPNNQETSFVWELSTEGEVGGTLTGSIESLPGEASLSGFGDQPANSTAKGLEPRTPYFYRVTAKNATGEESQGEVKSFTTLDEPLLTVAPAEHVTRTQAALSGTVNPGGTATTYHYVYVEAAGYNPGAGECEEGVACAYAAGRTTPLVSAGSDYEAHPAGPVEIDELKPGTTYDYALVATNSLGTEVGPNQELTTLPATAPSASTGEAFGVSQLSATITGTVDTRGLPTTMRFELLAPGTAAGNGSLIAATPGEQSGTTVQVSLTFSGTLQPGTTYGYRVIATNADGTAEGAIRQFTTSSFPEPPAFTSTPGFPLLAFPSIAELEAKEAKERPRVTEHTLTNTQKLAKALKQCRKNHSKARRRACEHQARKKYGPKRKGN